MRAGRVSTFKQSTLRTIQFHSSKQITKGKANKSTLNNNNNNNKNNEILKGVFAPIPTPFTADDNLNFDKLGENIENWLNRHMLDGLCVMGSNGEFPLLNYEEKEKLLSYVAQKVNKKEEKEVKLIAGTGAVSTKETIKLTNFAASLGYHAAMVVTPYYFTSRMNNDLLYSHYLHIADQSKIPIVLYSMPSFAGGVVIDVELAEKLSKHPNIIGMKDSSGNINQIIQIVEKTKENNFNMVAGTGSLFYEGLLYGCSGGIMALSNIMGDRLRFLHQWFIDHNEKRNSEGKQYSKEDQIGLEGNKIVAEYNTLITAKHSIPAVKYSLSQLGFYGGPVRSPIQPLSTETQKIVCQSLLDTNEKWDKWVQSLSP